MDAGLVTKKGTIIMKELFNEGIIVNKYNYKWMNKNLSVEESPPISTLVNIINQLNKKKDIKTKIIRKELLMCDG